MKVDLWMHYMKGVLKQLTHKRLPTRENLSGRDMHDVGDRQDQRDFLHDSRIHTKGGKPSGSSVLSRHLTLVLSTIGLGARRRE